MTTKLQKRMMRLTAIDLLGGRCVTCENDDWRVLQFDHINDDGSEDRERSGSSLVLSVVNGQRDDIQLLCANCHQIKTYWLTRE